MALCGAIPRGSDHPRYMPALPCNPTVGGGGISYHVVRRRKLRPIYLEQVTIECHGVGRIFSVEKQCGCKVQLDVD